MGFLGIGNSSSSSTTKKVTNVDERSADTTVADYSELDTKGGAVAKVQGIGKGAEVSLQSPQALQTAKEIAALGLDTGSGVAAEAVQALDKGQERSLNVASQVAQGQAAATIKQFMWPAAIAVGIYAAARYWG